MNSFYCKVTCGDPEFSIDQWNESYLEIEAMPISQSEKDKLIHGEPCEKQCFDCMAVVGKRQLETKELTSSIR